MGILRVKDHPGYSLFQDPHGQVQFFPRMNGKEDAPASSHEVFQGNDPPGPGVALRRDAGVPSGISGQFHHHGSRGRQPGDSRFVLVGGEGFEEDVPSRLHVSVGGNRDDPAQGLGALPEPRGKNQGVRTVFQGRRHHFLGPGIEKNPGFLHDRTSSIPTEPPRFPLLRLKNKKPRG